MTDIIKSELSNKTLETDKTPTPPAQEPTNVPEAPVVAPAEPAVPSQEVQPPTTKQAPPPSSKVVPGMNKQLLLTANSSNGNLVKWTCTQCKFWTANKANAIQHMKTKHPDYAENPQQQEPSEQQAATKEAVPEPAAAGGGAAKKAKESWKSFECFCSYKSTSKKEAVDHIATVHKGRPNMKFVNEVSLPESHFHLFCNRVKSFKKTRHFWGPNLGSNQYQPIYGRLSFPKIPCVFWPIFL